MSSRFSATWVSTFMPRAHARDLAERDYGLMDYTRPVSDLALDADAPTARRCISGKARPIEALSRGAPLRPDFAGFDRT